MILSRVSRRRPVRLLALGLAPLFAVLLALLLAVGRALAHEIPARVAVLAFVRPEGRVLRVVARVPLEAMRDVRLPLRDGVYLDVPQAGPALREAAELWVAGGIAVYEDDVRLAAPRVTAVRAALPSDRSFASWETALAGVRAALLPAATALPWRQAMLDVALEYDVRSDRSRFSLRPGLAHLGVQTTTVLRFLRPGGDEQLDERREPERVRGEAERAGRERDRVRRGERRHHADERPHAPQREHEAEHEQQVVDAAEDVAHA